MNLLQKAGGRVGLVLSPVRDNFGKVLGLDLYVHLLLIMLALPIIRWRKATVDPSAPVPIK